VLADAVVYDGGMVAPSRGVVVMPGGTGKYVMIAERNVCRCEWV